MNIRPLYDRVVVRRNEEEATSAGGIVLTSASKEVQNRGEVVAVGDGVVLENGDIRALQVKAGDQVIFAQHMHGAITIEEDGVEYVIMSEREIAGILG
ncbi:co-chaperone GroES [Oceanicoccus sagamiensis]|uniref:Co-chaperonin GroES n=1 Tax=Oceanicoccus sagamiensis TaxID=716816 RepID=A0A1X9N3W2_9GAMM|nr:co-chaperone GroES [Oceanicoccus sagamiensis]ARN72860.1 co-chaperone GroES [Oceanicoccus sagamiensis]